MKHLKDIGISPEAIKRYIEEQIFTLPGTKHPEKDLTILLTGSRATGGYTPHSDVDIDVICKRSVYNSIQQALLKKGSITLINQSLYILRDKDWKRYFGQQQVSRPHFSLTPIDEVTDHFKEYDDVHIWIWTKAKILNDPNNQFNSIREKFKGYPTNILLKKIKYRWLLSGYWDIEVFPYHHSKNNEIVPAATAILNSVNEFLRFFFLVEGKPFPYTEALVRFAPSTKLGKKFMPLLLYVVGLVTGKEWKDKEVWERLDEAHQILCCSDRSSECRSLENACTKAMLAAGVEPEWVKADFNNISELLSGKLGQIP
ncbi:MAG: DUF4037 domain-containing protein [bacterium]|nr:DUF4037 domain-containing protein [bacterium]